jgi:hypothetical protein
MKMVVAPERVSHGVEDLGNMDGQYWQERRQHQGSGHRW